jgi:hypothetical protein
MSPGSRKALRQLMRIPGAQSLWRRFPLGGVEVRVGFDIWERPAYAYGVHSAARLARCLSIPDLTVIEFGVAGGRGLVALQEAAELIGKHFGVRISVIGLDSGRGMPPPKDFRDLPHVWAEGFYKMDYQELRKRLRKTELMVGPVAETVPKLMQAELKSPIGFVAFDLDYYSSTKEALRIFDFDAATRLPRVFCYFDDLIWPEMACYNEYSGEYLAINEFNSEHAHQKIGKIPYLRWMRDQPAYWNEQVYVSHDFEHPLYRVNTTPAGKKYTQKPL